MNENKRGRGRPKKIKYPPGATVTCRLPGSVVAMIQQSADRYKVAPDVLLDLMFRQAISENFAAYNLRPFRDKAGHPQVTFALDRFYVEVHPTPERYLENAPDRFGPLCYSVRDSKNKIKSLRPGAKGNIHYSLEIAQSLIAALKENLKLYGGKFPEDDI